MHFDQKSVLIVDMIMSKHDWENRQYYRCVSINNYQIIEKLHVMRIEMNIIFVENLKVYTSFEGYILNF